MHEAESLDWDSLFSSGKKKKKKVKSCPSQVLTQKSKDNTPKKKKKSSKYKDAMDKRKAKRKQKKKNKKDKFFKLLSSLENDFVCFDEPEIAENVIQENTKIEPKKKRKKRVAFDLPHDYLQVKSPKFSSSLLSPVHDSTAPVYTDEEETEATKAGQIQAKNNDSQSTSDDMHSQDLFITQKTFRLPLSEMSSEETSDRQEDSAKVMGTCFRETKEKSVSFKTQKKKSELHRGKIKRSPLNPFLDEPIVVSSFPVGDKPKEMSVNTQLSQSQQKSMTSVYTQTENFFTTELTLYLNFCKKSQHQAQSEELKPLDLCLPDRARRDSKTSNKDQDEEEAGCGQLSMCAQRKEERTPSLESESDKSADTTVSSEDVEGPNRSTRLELMQVRAVQMRLNESFFFKTKGEAPSPRPESPLMKLVQGREVKSRKSH